MAKDDIETTVKGIKTAIETSTAKDDKVIDISEKEKTGVLKGGEYHLNARYDVNVEKIRNNSAKTKEERKTIAKELGFDDYKIIDPNNLPIEVIERNKELKDKKLGELKIFVDKNNVIYTVGNLTEEEFKKGLAREYGIINYGRIVKDEKGNDKLIGATVGEIFKEQVEGSGDNEIINLEYDKVNDEEIESIMSDAVHAFSVVGKISIGELFVGSGSIEGTMAINPKTKEVGFFISPGIGGGLGIATNLSNSFKYSYYPTLEKIEELSGLSPSVSANIGISTISTSVNAELTGKGGISTNVGIGSIIEASITGNLSYSFKINEKNFYLIFGRNSRIINEFEKIKRKYNIK